MSDDLIKAQIWVPGLSANLCDQPSLKPCAHSTMALGLARLRATGIFSFLSAAPNVYSLICL